MRRVALVLAVALAAAGCGGGSSSTTGKGELVVSAASSLKGAFTALGGARYSFAGSDQLAAQIRQGVKPDVFASANTKLPDALYKEGLVAKPEVFAGNRLVLAVPKASKITSVTDLETPGVKLAVGSADVPVGSYTREVVARLGPAAGKRILANVRSAEPDAKGVVGKLTQGAVDAGFVYVTDVDATKGALKAIELPAKLEPSVAYGIAVVKGAKHAGAAQAFVKSLRTGPGRQALRKAGFTTP